LPFNACSAFEARLAWPADGAAVPAARHLTVSGFYVASKIEDAQNAVDRSQVLGYALRPISVRPDQLGALFEHAIGGDGIGFCARRLHA
jgi:hypothetical protein